MRLFHFIRQRLINFYITVLAVLIVASAIMAWYNKQELIRTARIKAEAEQVKFLLDGIFERTLRSIDLGIRGFALTKNEQLLSPLDGAIRANPGNMRKIDSLLTLQKLDTSVTAFIPIKKEIDGYIALANNMKAMIIAGNHDEFLAVLNQDKGYDVWRMFAPFYANISVFENALLAKATADYESAMNRNLMVQVALIVLGFAILGSITVRLRKQARQRDEIFETLQASSVQYLFNPGEESGKTDHSGIINEVIGHFKRASGFITSIANGNYNTSWDGLNKSNESLNKQTIAGQLHAMRDKLINIRQEEEKRNWSNVGQAQYSEVVRKFQSNTESLCLESVRFITKYLKAQQAGLFVLATEGDQKYLNLAACFAFDKKKFVDKRINIGVGLVGQTFLEGQTVKMKELPSGYTHITSGLGDATPRCLVISPMKHNEHVVAVLEIASFYEFTPDHVQFIERCGEFLAAALFNAQTNDQIKKLLQDSQMQAEGMRAQEEEMRQNMEELSATQEEMVRKEREYINKIEKLESELNGSNQRMAD
jgi:CHASE3 domain sensor protein/putative methionine-R-sulfoxide reductase with GAF domain